MKFTLQNYRKEFPKLKNVSETLQESYEFACDAHEFYDKDKTIKETIDMFLKALNLQFGNNTNGATKTEKGQKNVKTKKEPKPKVEKPAKPADTAQRVEKILPEVGFIKRFCTLDGKMATKETRDSALRILNALQKAIVEKVIRKTSRYAKEITAIQDNLVAIMDYDHSYKIEIPEKYKEIAKSQKINPETAIIKAFIAIQGKEGKKTQAQALLAKTEKLENRSTQIVEIRLSLKQYISGETKTVEIESHALQGLYGLAGIDFAPKTGEVVSSMDFLGSQFDTIKLSGKWKTLIGNPDKNFRIMMYGKRSKST